VVGAAAVNAQTPTPETVSIPVASIAQPPPPGPATNVKAEDAPNDGGGSIRVTWVASPDDGAGHKNVLSYNILRAISSPTGAAAFDTVGSATAGNTEFTDGQTKDGVAYIYVVEAVASAPSLGGPPVTTTERSDPSAVAFSKGQWFHMGRLNALLGVIIVCGAILYFIQKASSGKDLFIRKIAGLDAVDEAVGRATEMGRKIFYIPGTQDMDEVQTLAGITILGRVAKVAAEYEATLEVPVSRSLVMVTCREVVKEAYLNAGRPEAYNDGMVYYLTDDQFGYAAGIDGLVMTSPPHSSSWVRFTLSR